MAVVATKITLNVGNKAKITYAKDEFYSPNSDLNDYTVTVYEDVALTRYYAELTAHQLQENEGEFFVSTNLTHLNDMLGISNA